MIPELETTVMMHTGDEYEARARAERYSELRRIAGAIANLLVPGSRTTRAHRQTAAERSAANDSHPKKNRAA